MMGSGPAAAAAATYWCEARARASFLIPVDAATHLLLWRKVAPLMESNTDRSGVALSCVIDR